MGLSMQKNITVPHPLLEPESFTIRGDYSAKCVAVYDGDTITVEMKFRQEQPELFKIRLLGINAPEIRVLKSVADREEIKKKAIEARDFLRDMVLDKEVTVNCAGLDGFGRVLGIITVKGVPKSINDIMLDEGHAEQFGSAR